MKKICILILLILILTGCTNKVPGDGNRTIDDSSFDTMLLHAGEKFTIDLSKFEDKYQFHTVKFNYNPSVIRINHKEELLALKLGESTVEVYLYYQDHLQVTVLLYKIIVVDYNDPKMKPINDGWDLRSLLIENPSGFYYLNQEISHNGLISGISYFSGILINPNKYIIKNLTLKSDSALIGKATNAYIDGLIFENLKITGIDNEETVSEFTAGLIGEAHTSFISNIHITGEVSKGTYVGGIIGYSYKTSLINSSFTGKVSGGKYTGGLVGYYRPDIYLKNIKDGVIKNCYVIADISGGYSEPRSSNYLGGLVGYANEGNIVSSYYYGKITPDEGDFHKPIIGGVPYNWYGLYDVYYVSDYELEDAYRKENIYPANIYKLTKEELTSGEGLKGLEDFTFIPGEYPLI